MQEHRWNDSARDQELEAYYQDNEATEDVDSSGEAVAKDDGGLM
jgi:hypothetical protein